MGVLGKQSKHSTTHWGLASFGDLGGVCVWGGGGICGRWGGGGGVLVCSPRRSEYNMGEMSRMPPNPAQKYNRNSLTCFLCVCHVCVCICVCICVCVRECVCICVCLFVCVYVCV